MNIQRVIRKKYASPLLGQTACRHVSAFHCGLSSVLPPLTLPTEVNVVFIGFNGDGESALNVSEAQLSPWFQQLRAVQQHSVLPDANHHQSATGAPHTALQYATRLHVHKRLLRSH